MLSRNIQKLSGKAFSGGNTPNPPTSGGYTQWPWPSQFPLKKQWWHHLTTSASIAQETRSVSLWCDLCIVTISAWAFFRIYQQHSSGVQQTRAKHLTNSPPAIIAQDFDFQNPENNRKVSRASLDQYREEVASKRTASIESFIFKY